MKKLISFILASALVFSSLCTSSIAFADETQYLYKQCFDSEKTNVIPGGITTIGSSSARVVNDGKSNKAFYVNTANFDNNINVNLGTISSRYVLSFQLKRVGCVFPLEIMATDETGNKLPILKGGEDGVLRLSDGKAIGGIGQNAYTKISMVADEENNFYSVYVGKSSAYKWQLPKKLSGAVTLSFTTVATEKESGLYIDNILLYSGTKVRNSNPSSSYNPEEVEYCEEDETNPIRKVYVRQNFEDPETQTDGFNLINKNNIIGVAESQGNRYLYFKQDNPELDMHADMTIGGETSKNIVVELDVRVDTPGMEVALIRISDGITNSTSTQSNIVSFNNLTLRSGGGVIGNLTVGKWYHISAVLNLTSNQFDLYVDNAKKVSGAPIHSTLSFRVLSMVRIMCTAGKSGDMLIDNVNIYDGKEPRDISGEEFVRESIFENDSVAENFLKTKTALNPYTGLLYTNGEKKLLDTLPVIDGDKIYITKDVAISFLPDIKDVQKAEKISANGNDMYLLDDLIKLSKRYVYDDDHGLFISSNSSFEASKLTLESAHRRASFVRPDAQQIKNELIKVNSSNIDRHPRIIATAEDFERIKSEIATDPRKKVWYEKILEDTESIMDAPVSVYNKYDGLRILQIAGEFERRMTNLGFCWQITGDRKYADRAWKEFEAVLKFPDWNAKSHFLDTGTMATGFAIGYDWFYDTLNSEQKQMIYDSALKNGLSQYMNAVYGNLGGDSSFVKSKTNWSPTCNGGILELALAVAEHDPDYCSEIISNTLKSLEYFWYYFAPDGAWHEGTGYWEATIWDTTLALASMNTAINTDYNMSAYKGLNQLPFFVPTMAGPTGALYNHHDTSGDYRSSPALFWMADKYDDSSAATLRLQFMNKYGLEPEIYDILWCDKNWNATDKIPFEKDRLYGGLEMVLMRSSFGDPDASFLAYHGAETYGGHNHYDAGSFVYEIDNERWAVDLGIDMQCYNVNYSKRGEFYRIRAEGHNVVVINPSEDPGQHRDGYAPITRFETSDKSAISVIDLSSDYPETTSYYQRGFYFTENRRVLTIRDEISLKDEAELYWFMHTGAVVEISDNNTAILTSGNKQLKVEFLVDADNYELSCMEAEPMSTSPVVEGQASNKSFRKLALKINDKGKTTITVKLSMLNDPVSDLPVNNQSISEWKLNENVTYQKPEEGSAQADMIYIGGKEISSFTHKPFDKTQKIYDIILYGQDGVPEVTAVSGERKVETRNSVLYDGTPYTTIKIYQDNGSYTLYVIKYQIIEEASMNFGDYRRHVVYNSHASAVPQPENGVSNSYDGFLETRWSTESGAYMVHDLGTTQKIEAFGAAFMNGTKRQTMFDIFVSEDGENYTLVYSGASSGTTDDIEIIELKETVNARYVKFLGHGNTENIWTSVTEFYALERK